MNLVALLYPASRNYADMSGSYPANSPTLFPEIVQSCPASPSTSLLYLPSRNCGELISHSSTVDFAFLMETAHRFPPSGSHLVANTSDSHYEILPPSDHYIAFPSSAGCLPRMPHSSLRCVLEHDKNASC